MAFYGSFILGISTDNFIDASFIAFQFPIFNIIFFSIIFFNTLNTCAVFGKRLIFYVIRLKNKKNFIKEVVKNVVSVNLFYILIFFITFFAFMLLFKGNNFRISNYHNYNVSNLFYLIFYLTRYTLCSILVSIVVSLIYLNFKTIVAIIVNFIFLVGFMVFTVSAVPKESVDFNIWKLFTRETFGNISLEITSTLIILFVLQLMILIFLQYTANNKKVVIS